MAKAENKTQPTQMPVSEFLDSIEDGERREDCEKLIEMMTELAGVEPVMWGPIVGFGQYHYRYESGREGDFLRTGFANRKTALTVYIMPGFDSYEDLLSKLGKYKTGKSCLYIKRLNDIDVDVLRRLVEASLAAMAEKYGPEERKK